MKTILVTVILSISLFASGNFNTALFEKAKKENKIILMDLEAVWCHWCHVMNETTYQDEKVLKILNEHFLVVHVDHDARPDLAQRYRKYGWPATIFFDSNGVEIVKRSGYIAPQDMARLLEAIVLDPSPEEITQKELLENDAYTLNSNLKKELLRRHNTLYDEKLGGLKSFQKYLEIDTIEYAMYRAKLGDIEQSKRAKKTLHAAMKLIDPVWGGAYQYSTHGDWEHPHYEKIMRMQAAYIKTYAIAALDFNNKKYLEASKKVTEYVFRFLQNPTSGAFYVSQDADLIQGQKAHDYFLFDNAKRLSLGIPKVDKNLYASSQGDMIEALAYLYKSSNEKIYLDGALKALNWSLQNRLVRGGGFKHGSDESILFLDDNLKMAKALLAMYSVTQNTRWLNQANFLANFIEKQFKAESSGVLTATDNGTPIKPVRQLDENIQTVLFFNRLAKVTSNSVKKERYLKFSQYVMKYLATENIALSRSTEAGILLCDEEFTH